MTHFKDSIEVNKTGFNYLYTDISKNDLEKKFRTLFTSNGYSCLSNTGSDSMYEKGSRVMRILLGAFIKYFKFRVIITSTSENEHTVKLIKETSGMSGGVIGINQVKKELDRLSRLFQNI